MENIHKNINLIMQILRYYLKAFQKCDKHIGKVDILLRALNTFGLSLKGNLSAEVEVKITVTKGFLSIITALYLFVSLICTLQV